MTISTHAPGRRTAATTAPPSRTDTRRPGPARRAPGPTAAEEAQRRHPHWWFAERLVEVLSGRRPIGRLMGHIAGEAVYERLWRLAAHGVLRPPAGRPVPVVRRCDHRAPAPGVLEVFARVASGDALRALAFRLERGGDGRWRCTAVDFAGPSW